MLMELTLSFLSKNGVSPMQEEQMRKQLGNNVEIVAINGNFDDAQSAIKVIFSSDEFKNMQMNTMLCFQVQIQLTSEDYSRKLYIM